jgi:tellurite resistance protein TerC
VVLDMFVLNRNKHQAPSVKRASLQFLLWVAVAVAFGAFIWAKFGSVGGQEYLTGYFMELSLSSDNVFVWSLVIGAFVLFRGYHHTLVMWGVMMSIVLRIVFITVGVTVIQKFAFITVVLAAFLIYTGIKLKMSDDDDEFNLQESGSYRFISRFVPMSKDTYGTSLVTRQEGGIKLTVFGIAVIMFGLIDVMFAVDSVPAILAVARDPFVIIASNIMALLGLQTLYFLFDAVKNAFSKLNEGLAVILAGIGVKMLIASEVFIHGINWVLDRVGVAWRAEPYELPTVYSLIGIVSILAICIVWSVLSKEKDLPVASMDEELQVSTSPFSFRVQPVKR